MQDVDAHKLPLLTILGNVHVSRAGRLTTHHHVPLLHHLVHQYTKYQLVSGEIVASCRGIRKVSDWLKTANLRRLTAFPEQMTKRRPVL